MSSVFAAPSQVVSRSLSKGPSKRETVLPDHMLLETRNAVADVLQKRLQTPQLQSLFEQHAAYMRQGGVPWKASDRPPARRSYERPLGGNRSKAIVFLFECCGGLPCCATPQQFVLEERSNEEERPPPKAPRPGEAHR